MNLFLLKGQYYDNLLPSLEHRTFQMTSMYCTTELDDVISLLLGCHRKSEIKYREHDGTSLTLKVQQFFSGSPGIFKFCFYKKKIPNFFNRRNLNSTHNVKGQS